VARRRELVAEIGDDDYLIVKYTHDVTLALNLMAAKLKSEWWDPPADVDERIARRLGLPVLRWVRCLGPLPGSHAEWEGWAYAFHEHDAPSRGAFPAVVFRT
jgi:hypothetical protein